MLNLVLNGILQKRPDFDGALGLIPFGTGNDFAGASGIPCNSVSEALEIAIHAEPVMIDVGQANETFFVNVAAGGFPAEATAEISQTTKALLGKFAYLLTGLTNIGNLAAKTVAFRAPDFEWASAVYAFGLGNGRQAGGGLKVCPTAVVNDGLLDLMIVPESDEGIVTLVSDYLRMGPGGETEHIIYRQIPWVNVTSRETISLNLDGEPLEGKKFQFKVHARHLPFCLPKSAPILYPPEAAL
jgi:lipid kinase YegS